MSTKTILLVDDDTAFLEVMSAALKRRDYAVFCASDLVRAAGIAQSEPLDYAVIDLKIDSESGLDCIPLLKQHHPAIRILMLTGYSSIATAVSAIKAGAMDYACKPVDVDEMLQLLKGEKGDAQRVIRDSPPSVQRLQWEHIQRVLETNNGNISATARDLGMHRRTLQRKLQKRPVKH